MNSKTRAALQNCSLLALSVLAAIIGAEFLVRALGSPGRLQAKGTLITTYDPLLGWSKAPNQSVEHHTSEYQVTESINSKGLRGPEVAYQKPLGSSRVLLLGDSFVEGYSVDSDALVSKVLQDRLQAVSATPVKVINGGTAGYSTDQELLFFELEGQRYSPDITILFFYVNDIWYNRQGHYWRGSKPLYRLSEEGLSLTNTPIAPPDSDQFAFEVKGGRGVSRTVRQLDGWLGTRSALYNLLRERILKAASVQRLMIRVGLAEIPGEWRPWSRDPGALADAWSMTEALLAALRDQVEQAQSQFLLFYIPSRAAVYPEDWNRIKWSYAMSDADWSPSADADRLSGICERLALNCLIELTAFKKKAEELRDFSEKLYYETDGHWTPAGHRLAAELIAAQLTR